MRCTSFNFTFWTDGDGVFCVSHDGCEMRIWSFLGVFARLRTGFGVFLSFA